MLVSIQFPCDFAVADFAEIQILDRVKGLERRTLAMGGIQMPIDVLAIIEIFESKKIEAMSKDAICLRNNLLDGMRNSLAHERDDLFHLEWFEEKRSALDVLTDKWILREVVINTRKQSVPAFLDFLARAIT